MYCTKDQVFYIPQKSGFTLLEVMVALAIFALAASALMVTDGSSIRQMTHIRDTVVASSLAEEVMKEIYISADSEPLYPLSKSENRFYNGWDWVVQTDIEAGPYPSFYSVMITVKRDAVGASHNANYAYQLTGHIRANQLP